MLTGCMQQKATCATASLPLNYQSDLPAGLWLGCTCHAALAPAPGSGAERRPLRTAQAQLGAPRRHARLSNAHPAQWHGGWRVGLRRQQAGGGPRSRPAPCVHPGRRRTLRPPRPACWQRSRPSAWSGGSRTLLSLPGEVLSTREARWQCRSRLASFLMVAAS